MIQKNIRDWGNQAYTNAEADELTQELNDRTKSSQEGYNSIDEAATKLKAAETNINAKEDKSSKGSANGYAELDATGKVPAAQLPAGVDEVQEYADLASFPVTGSSSVIYVALDTNKTYRWGGTTYVEIASGSLVLGETSTTAYRGDRGKVAYDHSQTPHAPSDAEANQSNAQIKVQYEANADTNAFTDTDKTKLDQIESNATADQTGAEIKVAYEAEANTNAFTDAEKTNLGNQSNTNTGDQDISGIATNASAITTIQGEQTTQDSAIALNTAKVSYTDGAIVAKAIVSDTTVAGGGTALTNMVEITQAAYDALTPDVNTWYFING